MPPVAAMTTASTRNCSMMSLAARADGHADADLAGAFGDRHEHDVHDADAADEQRDRRRRCRAGPPSSAPCSAPLRRCRRDCDREVVVATVGDAVALAQQ